MTQALHLWAYTNTRGELYLDRPTALPSERKASILDSFTLLEKLYLLFQKDRIHNSVKAGRDITYLPAVSADNMEKQKDFYVWVNQNYPSQRFAARELDLMKIIPSIWSKTKKFCEGRCDSKEIVDEKRRQKQADGFIARLRWYTGNAFTTRQSAVLFNAINEIEQSSNSNI